MRDLEDDEMAVIVMPYKTKLASTYRPTICIEHDFGKLLPLSRSQALQLARKLIKAVADELDP